MSSDVIFGDPFLFSVGDTNLDGKMDDFAVDGHLGVFPVADEAMLRTAVNEDVSTHGGSCRVFVCIPIAHVWANENDADGEERKVNVEWADNELEKMARAAIAMGVVNETPGSADEE